MTDTIRVSISEGPIDCGALVRDHGASHHGAQVSFFGVVRDVNFGRQVTGIEYDAYIPLAETTFRAFCDEAQTKWGQDVRITVVHRVGALGVGDISVALIVSTRHRSEAYAVSRYVIEELKHRSPIWKKEHYNDGSSDWVQGHALCQHEREEPVHEHEHLQSYGTGRVMNIRLGESSIRLRLNGGEAETLLQINQLTITVSWVTGADLRCTMILSADAARPRVRSEGMDLLVVIPRSDFIELLEQFGRRDAAISWTEFGTQSQDVAWSLDIDAFRSRSKSDRSQHRVETLDLL